MLKTKENKGLLIALALGDGYLRVQNNSSYIQIEHSHRQFEYINYKKKLLEKIFRCKPINLHRRERLDKRTNKIYVSYILTKGHKYFKILKKFVYPNNKKTYLASVLNFLTPEGLAIWYQDDGYLNRKYTSAGNFSTYYLTLSTYCSKEEADVIIHFFKEKYNIICTAGFHKSMQSWNINFNKINSDKLIDLITPYIIPEMQYKLPCFYVARVLDSRKSKKYLIPVEEIVRTSEET